MVSASTRKMTAEKNRSPAKDRRSVTRTQNAEASLASSSNASGSPGKAETPRTARYSHRLPTDQQRRGNGRVAGRNLIMWNRPRMAEKLLLHIHYECSRHKLQLPWDAIAHRLHPGSSGAAVIQHLNRLRRQLFAEGHVVPPATQRSYAAHNDANTNVRGYVRRDTDGDDFEASRPVEFDEKLDDPKFNLPGDFSMLDEEFVEPDDFHGSQSPGSEEGDYRHQSPTPIRRASSKSSSGSTGSHDAAFLPQVAPVEVVRDTRGRSPNLLQPFSYETLETEPKHVRHPSQESSNGTGLCEAPVLPEDSFESKVPILGTTTTQQRYPSPNTHGQMNSYALATFPSLHHAFMYPMAGSQSVHCPAHSFDHPDYMTAPFPMTVPMPVAHQFNPYMTLDPSLIKQGKERSAPTVAELGTEAMKSGTVADDGAEIGDPFAGSSDSDANKACLPT